jgi:hypothetical protein
MNAEKLFEAITDIDDSLVTEANLPMKRFHPWVAISLAACFVAVFTVFSILNYPSKSPINSQLPMLSVEDLNQGYASGWEAYMEYDAKELSNGNP